MTATVDQALANLAHASEIGRTYDWNPGDGPSGWCLRCQRYEHDVPGGVDTAWDSALLAMPLQPTAPPRGGVLYWSGGGSGAGHIATSDGLGNCWTTDFYRTGKVDLAPVSDINRAWSNLEYRGWGSSINGVRVLGDQGEGGGHEQLPEDDMTPEECEAVVRKVLAEGKAFGQESWASTVQATLGAAQATFNAASALPLGTWRIKLPDADAQYLITGGARVWIKSQQALGELGADTVPLEIVAADDTRWSFPLVGPDAPG